MLFCKAATLCTWSANTSFADLFQGSFSRATIIRAELRDLDCDHAIQLPLSGTFVSVVHLIPQIR